METKKKLNNITKLNTAEIKRIDTENMFQLLSNYWSDLKVAVNNAKQNNAIFNISAENDFFDILILGIGGSAMSGELLKSYLKYLIGTQKVKFNLVRGWDIPDGINENTCVFVCSYSGNTNETLTAFEKVEKFTRNIISVTSGGKLAAKCKQNNYPILEIPQGMMPRCAMFYSFFHLLFTIFRQGLIPENAAQELNNSINEICSEARKEFFDFSDFSVQNNQAIELANLLVGKIPIIYTAQARMEAVNLRWKSQIQENANQVCFGNFFPELNHNEINGWMFPSAFLKDFFLISITDKDDSEQLNNSIKSGMELLQGIGLDAINISTDATYLLTRIYQLICLGDWLSFYLAIFNNISPTPIPIITKLKQQNS